MPTLGDSELSRGRMYPGAGHWQGLVLALLFWVSRQVHPRAPRNLRVLLWKMNIGLDCL